MVKSLQLSWRAVLMLAVVIAAPILLVQLNTPGTYTPAMVQDITKFLYNSKRPSRVEKVVYQDSKGRELTVTGQANLAKLSQALKAGKYPSGVHMESAYKRPRPQGHLRLYFMDSQKSPDLTLEYFDPPQGGLMLTIPDISFGGGTGVEYTGDADWLRAEFQKLR